MLGSLRNFASSLLGRMFFALLAFCFVIIFSMDQGITSLIMGKKHPTIATIGSKKITTKEFYHFVNGLNIKLAEIKKHGLVRDIVTRLVEGALLDYEADRMGITVSNEAVRAQIAQNFSKSGGEFNRKLFLYTISHSGMSEEEFVQVQKKQMRRELLIEMIMSGFFLNYDLIEKVNKFHRQKRVIRIMGIRTSDTQNQPKTPPTDKELQDFHDQHSFEFRVPEYRSCEVILYPIANIETRAKLRANDPENLKAEYEKRKADLKGKSFEEARQQLSDDLFQNAKSEFQTEIEQKIEDFLASGESMDKITEDLDVKIIKFENFTKKGTFKSGDKVENAQAFEVARSSAYELVDTGDSSEILSLDNGDYVVIRLTTIDPSHVPEFNKIKASVTKKWRRNRALDYAKSTILEWLQKINSGESSNFKVDDKNSYGLVTVGRDVRNLMERFSINPRKYSKELFKLDKGKGLIAHSSGGEYVYILKVEDIISFNQPTSKNELKKLRLTLNNIMARDAKAYYMHHLKLRHRVDYNQAVIKQLSSIRS